MANVQWRINGDYFEACSCDFVCPCPTSGLAASPTKGACDAGLVFQVSRGQYGSTTLDGLSFAVLLHTPGPMIAGNWTVRSRLWTSAAHTSSVRRSQRSPAVRRAGPWPPSLR